MKKYKCEFADCNRSFAQKAPWKTHMDTHKGVKTHVSQGSDASFPGASTLTGNQQQCDVCGIWVSQAGNLQVGAPAVHSTGTTDPGRITQDTLSDDA